MHAKITLLVLQLSPTPLLSHRLFNTVTVHFPSFSTCGVHRNYIDCVRWLGDALLSKSTDNRIVCWVPGGQQRLDLEEQHIAYLGDPVTILRRYEYSSCDIWYVRFALDRPCTHIAIGNQAGKVFVWSLKRKSPTPVQVLEHKKCTSTVRQVDFNYNSMILISVCDDGTIWRWDLTS
eukprot:m.53531 g.53531  ORF g.53531 m.53531 type:complete len:177 (+) comp15426_c0_seq3:47-577(+)